MAEDVEFKPGDIVVLKSGGPEMTIDKISKASYESMESAVCVWFEGKKKCSELFKLTSLELASKKD